MTGLTSGPLAWLLPLIVLTAALVMGPLPIVVRGYVRRIAGPAHVHRWFRPVSFGFGIGMIAAVAVIARLDGALALGTALLCLLFLLGSIDWQWRWLPIEWTLSVIALGLIFAFQSTDAVQVFIQMVLPAGALFVLRQGLLWSLGKEALGLGDIWLIAGLGAFLEPFQSFLLIGFAALSGLLEIGVRRLKNDKRPAKIGVSYGTHLCIIFVIIRNLSQFS
jgi:prepilin signal peptidase PulO-like enzyme (type II secretory pathway)